MRAHTRTPSAHGEAASYAPAASASASASASAAAAASASAAAAVESPLRSVGGSLPSAAWLG